MKDVVVKVDSEDLIKVIKELISDEAKSQARSIAQKEFNKALENKAASILHKVDEDIGDSAWSYSSTRKSIIKKVEEAIEKQFQGDELKHYIKEQIDKELTYFRAEVASSLDRQIKLQVEKKVNDIFKDRLISELFSRLTSSNKEE